jgi:hypothetical protein
MAFERLVRPFATPAVAPSKAAPAAPAAGAGPLRVSLSGTASAGAQLTLTVASAALTGSPIVVGYMLDANDTLATAALAMVAAINGHAALAAAGIVAAIVPTRPLEFTVTQPSSLNPQATFSGAASGGVNMEIENKNVVIQAGRRGRVTVWNTSFSSEVTVYVIKYPKEVPEAEVPPEMRTAIAVAAARFRNS